MAREVRPFQFSRLTLVCVPLVVGVILSVHQALGFDRTAAFVQQWVILALVFVRLVRWRKERFDDESGIP